MTNQLKRMRRNQTYFVNIINYLITSVTSKNKYIFFINSASMSPLVTSPATPSILHALPLILMFLSCPSIFFDSTTLHRQTFDLREQTRMKENVSTSLMKFSLSIGDILSANFTFLLTKETCIILVICLIFSVDDHSTTFVWTFHWAERTIHNVSFKVFQLSNISNVCIVSGLVTFKPFIFVSFVCGSHPIITLDNCFSS